MFWRASSPVTMVPESTGSVGVTTAPISIAPQKETPPKSAHASSPLTPHITSIPSVRSAESVCQ
jgi:hypothetical protein